MNKSGNSNFELKWKAGKRVEMKSGKAEKRETINKQLLD